MTENQTPKITVVAGQTPDLRRIKTQALVLTLQSGQMATKNSWTGTALDATISSWHDKGSFKGRCGEAAVMPSHGLIEAESVVLLGFGEFPVHLNKVREAAIRLGRTALSHRLETVDVLLEANGFKRSRQPEPGDLTLSEAVRVFTEGVLLGQYQYAQYKQKREKPFTIQALRLHIAVEAPENGEQITQAAMDEAVKQGIIGAGAVNYARDLTNLPGNYLIPETLAEEGRRLAEQFGLFCEILDEGKLRELGLGGLLAVGQGSVLPPRLLVLKYQGLEEWRDATALIGKGITFDTGGISIKPGDKMEEMISDMGGAAVLLGVMKAAAELKPKTNLICVIAAAENMPSGSAFKPGDIITTLSGKTIEVLNTDAEGRVVLADAMTYAIRSGGIARVLDVATLTGNVLLALGDVATLALANDEGFWAELDQSAANAGEKVWRFPIYEEYREKLRSDFADLNNSPGKWAAGITAGLFIGEFAEDLPWIHLDTGGTAWLWQEGKTEPKWGTGAMTRTLVEMLVRTGPLKS